MSYEALVIKLKTVLEGSGRFWGQHGSRLQEENHGWCTLHGGLIIIYLLDMRNCVPITCRFVPFVHVRAVPRMGEMMSQPCEIN